MLTAYVDDSGTGANDAIAVAAGYVATQHMGDRFQTRWQVLLRKYEIRQMHRSDLETFHGEFKTWDPAKRTDFLKKTHAIIRNCTYSGIGLALVKSDYEKVIANHPGQANFGVYAWCAQGCLAAAIHLWQHQNGLNEPVRFVFEAGTTGSGQFDAILQIIYREQGVSRHTSPRRLVFRGQTNASASGGGCCRL